MNPLEDSRWDAKLAQVPGTTLFHASAWSQVLRDTYGFKPVYFTAGSRERLDSLLPVMEVDSWLTGRRGIALPFTDECAPLCRTPDQFNRLKAGALVHARLRGWKYLEYRGGTTHFAGTPASTSYFGHSLDLAQGEPGLFARMEPAARRAVRKAEQSGLTITVTQDLASMRTFYRLLCLTRKRHGLPAQPFRFFANIQRHILVKNLGQIFLASRGAVPVAGAVYFHWQDQAIYKFGASDESLQHLRANNLVMWEAIKWHARRRFACLDFGRTSCSNEGLRRFKLSWGTIERKIDYFRHDLGTGAFIPVRDAASGWYNRIFRLTPVSVSRVAGAWLYKHVA